MFKKLLGYVKNVSQIMYWSIKSKLMTSAKKDLEILDLRGQLAVFKE